MQKEIKDSLASTWLGPHIDQASFALLVIDTFCQPCLRKRREPMASLRETGRVGRKGGCEREVSTLLVPKVSLTCTLNEFPITENIVPEDSRTRTRSGSRSACRPGLWRSPAAGERGFCAGKRQGRCTSKVLLCKVFLYLEVRPSSPGSERADNANECVIQEPLSPGSSAGIKGAGEGAQMEAAGVKHEDSHHPKDSEGSGEEGQAGLWDKGVGGGSGADTNRLHRFLKFSSHPIPASLQV